MEEQQHRFPSSKLRSDPERKKRKKKRKEVGREGRRNRHVTTSSRSLPPSHGKGREGKVVLPQLDLYYDHRSRGGGGKGALDGRA